MFTAEATNLLGEGIFRLARQPAGGDMVAATTQGPARAAAQARRREATWNAAGGRAEVG